MSGPESHSVRYLNKRQVIRDLPRIVQDCLDNLDPRKEALLAKLARLDLETASAEEVLSIVKNGAFLRIDCDICNAEADDAVEAEAPYISDYSDVITICRECVTRVSTALEKGSRGDT